MFAAVSGSANKRLASKRGVLWTRIASPITLWCPCHNSELYKAPGPPQTSTPSLTQQWTAVGINIMLGKVNHNTHAVRPFPSHLLSSSGHGLSQNGNRKMFLWKRKKKGTFADKHHLITRPQHETFCWTQKKSKKIGQTRRDEMTRYLQGRPANVCSWINITTIVQLIASSTMRTRLMKHTLEIKNQVVTFVRDRMKLSNRHRKIEALKKKAQYGLWNTSTEKKH